METPPANALRDAVDSDGFTRLERGMIDRELFPKLPKKSRARRKYVRRIRKRRELVVCDLVADDAKTLTMPLHTLLHTHTVGDPIPAGRARGHRLPEDIAQKLQASALDDGDREDHTRRDTAKQTQASGKTNCGQKGDRHERVKQE